MIQCSVLMIGALMLLGGCGGGSRKELPMVPPGGSESPDFRITSVALPEWYSTLTVVPEVMVTGEVASWSWDFGAGALPTTSTEALPTVTLQAPGNYPGTLTIRDAIGRAATIEFAYRVLAPEAPSIDSISPTGVVGEQFTSVTYEATIGGGPVDVWHWSFANGGSPIRSELMAPTIVLPAAGQYAGTLEVCGPFGCSPVHEFAYESREPRFVWHPISAPVLSSPHASEIAIVRVTSDGQVALVYGEDIPGEPEQRLQLALADGDAAISTAPDWTIRTLAQFEREIGTLNVALAENKLWALAGLGSYYEADRPSILLRTTLDGTETVSLELPDCEALWRNRGTTSDGHPMFAIGDRLYFAAVSRTISGSHLILTTDLFTLTTTDQQLPPPVLQLSARGDTSDLDMIVQDGQLHFALGRSGSGVGPDSFLEVGRRAGDPHGATGDWTVVVVDDARARIGGVTIIPTDTGTHLWYGAYHSWTQSYPEEGGYPYSVPVDYAMREAWTSERLFSGSTPWQTRRADELPNSFTLDAFSVRGRPLLLAGPSSKGYDGFHAARGLPIEGGAQQWLQHFEELNLIWLTLFSIGPDVDGAWIGFVDYEYAYQSCGNSGCTLNLEAPRLIIGKLALE